MAPACKACRTEYNTQERVPVSLSCGHNFCRKCLIDLQSNTLSFKCPTCIQTHSGPSVTDLPAQLQILNLKTTDLEPPNTPKNDTSTEKESLLCLIQTSQDTQIPLRLQKSSKLYDIKLLLQVQYGLDSSSGFITFEGERLLDEKSLSDYNITSGAVLHLDGVEGEEEIINHLGKGGFGDVFLVKRNGRTLVLKKVDLTPLHAKPRSLAIQEMKLLESLNHPNIVSYEGGYKKKECLHIFMEYCSGGDLAHKIDFSKEKGILFDETQILIWIRKITEGLEYIHNRKIIHRDIKPANIFLSKSGTIKIGDFGISRVLSDDTTRGSTMIGTAKYTAIEVLNNEGFSTKSDMFSLGCTVFEIAALKTDYPYVRINIPKVFTDDFKSIVKILLDHDPKNRPDAKELLAQPILKNIKEEESNSNSSMLQELDHYHNHLLDNSERERTIINLKTAIKEQLPSNNSEEITSSDDNTLQGLEHLHISSKDNTEPDEHTVINLKTQIKEQLPPAPGPKPLPRKKKKKAPPIPPRPGSQSLPGTTCLAVLNKFCDDYESGRNPDQVIGLRDIITCMNTHWQNRHIQMQGCLALSYIAIQMDGKVLTAATRTQIVDILLRAMQSNPKDWQLRAATCQSLCQYANPVDLLPRILQIVPQLLKLIQETSEQRDTWTCLHALYLIQLMSCRVGEEFRIIMEQFGTFDVLNNIITTRTDQESYEDLYKRSWSIICNLTDDTPMNCHRFIQCHGLPLILDCVSNIGEPYQQDRSLWNSLCNLSEFKEPRKLLLTEEYTTVLLQRLDHNSYGSELSWKAAKILVHLLWDGEYAWPTNPSRSLVISKIEEVMASWDLDLQPKCSFKTLRPFWLLLKASHTPVCQYWSIWTLANLIRIHGNTYCPMVIKEKGLNHLRQLLISMSKAEKKMPVTPSRIPKASETNASSSILFLTVQVSSTCNDYMAHRTRNPDQTMGLLTASADGDVDAVVDMSRSSTNLDTPSSLPAHNGRCALHLATLNGHAEVIGALLDAGASVDSDDGEGMTSLHIAAWRGRLDLLKLLNIYGADLYAESKRKGWTVVHFACAGGHQHILDFLSERCDIGEVTQDHRTALHIAAGYGKVDAIRWLMFKGLNIQYRDARGRTALDVATRKGYSQIVDILTHPSNSH